MAKRKRFDKKDSVLTPHKRKLLRKKFPAAEFWSAVTVLVALLGGGWWVLAQKNNYDPGERDISIEALTESSVEDNLYREPMKRWVDPSRRSAAGGMPLVDTGIFPATLVADGWDLDGRVEIFEPDTLYEKINGQAEQYLAYGFQRLHHATLAKDDAYLTVELYDQQRFENALGVFAAQRDEGRPVVQEGQVFYDETSAGAFGVYGPYFFKISGSATSEAVVNKAGQLLKTVAGVAAPADGRARAFEALTGKLGLDFADVAYEPENVFQYDFMKEVWFGRAGGDARYFVHEAQDVESAQTLLAQLGEEQEFDYEKVATEGATTLYKHRYLDTWFGVEARGALLLGVEGAADRATLESLMSRLRKATSDGQEA
jgi:hypothetical protein